MNTRETRDILSANANETEALHLLSALMHYNILLSVHNHYSLLCCQPEPEKYSETRICWNLIFETDNNSTDFILGDSFIFSPWLYNFNILWQLYFRSRPRHCFKNLRNASITRTRNWRLEKSLEIPASVCPPSDLRHVDPGAWPLPVSSVRSKGQCQDWSEEAIAGHRAWAGNTLQR